MAEKKFPANIYVTPQTREKLHNLKNDLRVSSIDKAVNHLLKVLDDYKKIKRIGFTDEEKLKILNEQGKKIVEEVEKLKNKNQEDGK